MNKADYKLNSKKKFKSNEAREYVVKFVVKTFDIIAFPLVTGEALEKNLFKIT